MTWQIHDPAVHDADEWRDVPGTFRDADSVAHAYLSDLDPLDYDSGRTFKLRVRRSADAAEQTVTVSIQPIRWLVNGR